MKGMFVIHTMQSPYNLIRSITERSGMRDEGGACCMYRGDKNFTHNFQSIT
jgi:hypothetical protein